MRRRTTTTRASLGALVITILSCATSVSAAVTSTFLQLTEPLDQTQALENSEPRDEDPYPWFVSPTGSRLCSGSLVHPDVVVTAAQCASAFVVGEFVNIGTSEIRNVPTAASREILQVLPHPDYQEGSASNDVMLIKLSPGAAGDEDTSSPISLHENPNTPLAGETLVTLAYDFSIEQNRVVWNVDEVEMTAVSHSDCQAAYTEFVVINQDLTLCANVLGGGGGGCIGDLGAPLLRQQDGMLVGIVSSGCAKPDTFARVSGNYEWIQDSICEISANPPPETCSGSFIPDVVDSSPPPPDTAPSPEPVVPGIDQGELTVRLVVQYDAAPDETTFLIRQQEGQVIYRGPSEYTPGPNEKWETKFEQFPQGSFNFVMLDSAGDGLGSGNVLGYFEIWQEFSDGSETMLALGDH